MATENKKLLLGKIKKENEKYNFPTKKKGNTLKK